MDAVALLWESGSTFAIDKLLCDGAISTDEYLEAAKIAVRKPRTESFNLASKYQDKLEQYYTAKGEGC